VVAFWAEVLAQRVSKAGVLNVVNEIAIIEYCLEDAMA
jgi:hypothetical protein